MTEHECDFLQNVMYYRLRHKSRIHVHYMVSSIKKSYNLGAFAVQRNLVLQSEGGRPFDLVSRRTSSIQLIFFRKRIVQNQVQFTLGCQQHFECKKKLSLLFINTLLLITQTVWACCSISTSLWVGIRMCYGPWSLNLRSTDL